MTVDLLVIGFGAAGAAAALTGSQRGADVLVVEKAPHGGGSTRVSGGNIRLVRERAGAVEHLLHLAGAGVTRADIEALVDGLVDLPAWLEEVGATLVAHDEQSVQALDRSRPGTSYPEVPGAAGLGSRVRVASGARPAGEALWDLLEDAVAKSGATVMAESPATTLIKEGQRVVGAVVRTDGAYVHVRALAGVILCSGGFERDDALLADALGAVPPSLSPLGQGAGDGVRMAQRVGAQLWHMNAVTARYGFVVPGHEAAFRLTPPAQGIFLTDRSGRRYVDETAIDGHSAALLMLSRDAASGDLTRFPSLVVFDERTRRAGPLGRQTSGANRDYAWSPDNAREIAAGWILRANTLADLAVLAGVDPVELTRTATAYNDACLNGNDQWGRPVERMEPLDRGPFYAIPLLPVLLNTQGGPRRDAAGRVLDADGYPIDGLFSAGELGSLFGPLYPGALNIAEALVSGARAAASAVGRREFPGVGVGPQTGEPYPRRLPTSSRPVHEVDHQKKDEVSPT